MKKITKTFLRLILLCSITNQANASDSAIYTSENTAFGIISLENQQQIDNLTTAYAASYIVNNICNNQSNNHEFNKIIQNILNSKTTAIAGHPGLKYALDSSGRKIKAFSLAYKFAKCNDEKIVNLASMAKNLGF